jgi:hypothetical protein
MTTSPFKWNSKMLPLMQMLDSIVALAKSDEIRLSNEHYDELLRSIHPNQRKEYEDNLRYKGKKLIRGRK